MLLTRVLAICYTDLEFQKIFKDLCKKALADEATLGKYPNLQRDIEFFLDILERVAYVEHEVRPEYEERLKELNESLTESIKVVATYGHDEYWMYQHSNRNADIFEYLASFGVVTEVTFISNTRRNRFTLNSLGLVIDELLISLGCKEEDAQGLEVNKKFATQMRELSQMILDGATYEECREKYPMYLVEQFFMK